MKNQIIRWVSEGVLTILTLTLFYACSKKDSLNSSQPGPDQNKISLYLTDDPGYFDKVLVDIQSVAVKIDTSTSWWGHNGWGDEHDDDGNDHDGDDHGNHGHHWGNRDQHDKGAIWDTLSINPGMYDLLNFANGADTLLTSDNIPKGRVIAFRITLGKNNSLVKDSVEYPLHLIPGWNNVYIRVFGPNFEKMASNHYKIWIDFDAGRSVIRLRQGMFYLRPVLKAFAVSNTGSVRGNVVPKDAFPVISVYNDQDTSYAIPERHGMFMVRGLAEGAYNVFINASNGYQDTTLTNISVKAGKTEDIGNIHLHK